MVRCAPILAAGCVALLSYALASPARAAEPAVFAIAIGVNQSPDPGMPQLRYADDDAVRFYDLFELLGARVQLYARLDDNTRRLHTAAARVARLPHRVELEQGVRALAGAVALAQSQGRPTVFYLAYAGHGDASDRAGYLTLEDSRLTGDQLLSLVIDGVGADRTHVIIDACHAYEVALVRGPGGEREPMHGFSAPDLLRRDDVGLLLASTATREAHEWAAFQAGVFSHEVRSGLFGAADADTDGLVSYPELAAFVRRANEAIPNERYRPNIFAKAPSASDTFADLRLAPGDRIRIGQRWHGRYFLETAQGVRLLDLHSAPGQALVLLKPNSPELLYLHETKRHLEYRIRSRPGEVRLASLRGKRSASATRGAAQHAFQQLFTLPYSTQTVAAVAGLPLDGSWLPQQSTPRALLTGLDYAGIGTMVLGAGAAAIAAWAGIAAVTRGDEVTQATSNATAATMAQEIELGNGVAWIAGGVAAVAAATGLLLLLWPDAAPVELEPGVRSP